LTALEKSVRGFKPITSTIDKTTGKRVFHCPPLALGRLCWGPATKPCADCDPLGNPEKEVKAIGDVPVPANRPIWIKADWALSREIFDCPELLAKFGPNELAGLQLHANMAVVDADAAAIEKSVTATMAAVIKATSRWTNLQYIEIYNLPATDECLTELDKHKTLRRLVLHQSDANVEFLGQRQFLRQLTSTELFDLPDSSAVMSGFKASKAISSIHLHDTTVSASALADLASCPNLAYVEINTCPLDGKAVEALSTINSLKALCIVQAKLEKSQIAALSKLAFIPTLGLDVRDWDDSDRAKLAKALPKANLFWHKQKQIPAEADR
jgi:hypothetical protein